MKTVLYRSTGFVVLYWLLFQSAAWFEVAPHVSAFYPASGLTLIFIRVYGWRYLPVVAAGVISTTAVPDLAFDLNALLQSLRQIFVYGIAGVLWRNMGGGISPSSIQTKPVSFFVLLALEASCASAVIAVGIFKYLGTFPPDLLLSVFFSFWAGDAAGILMGVAVIALVVEALQRKKSGGAFLNFEHRIEALVIFIPAMITSLIFSFHLEGVNIGSYGYLIVLPVAWVAARYGITIGVFSAVLSNMAAVLVYNLSGDGTYPAVELQTLFAVTTIVALLMGGSVNSRLAAEAAIIKKELEIARFGRLVAINEMGSTILHEINTPIQTASSSAYLGLMDYDKGTATLEGMAGRLKDVGDALELVSAIQSRIRKFISGDGSQIETTNINKILLEAVVFLNKQMKDTETEIQLNLQNELPDCRVDAIEFEQVSINLVKNACEAMQDMDPKLRKIRISSEVEDHRQIKVTVSDNGTGVSEDLQAQIFESFKTTKSNGVGMGLSICRTLMESFGGSIDVESDGRMGSAFILRLPIAKGIA